MTAIKYPRTYHLPSSAGTTSDDKVLNTIEHFIGKQVVITEKMDGENTTLYSDKYHARSIDSRYHTSRSWVAQFHSSIAHNIPTNWRVCGENVYAKHSLLYTNLPSYFLGFSIWDENNVCLDWNSTLEYFTMLGITPVNTLYAGVFDNSVVDTLVSTIDTSITEGFVVRLAESFAYDDFKMSVGKWVRANHVQTDKHWRTSKIIENQLNVI